MRQLRMQKYNSRLTSVDADATSAVASGEITALAHEIRDDSVECGGLVSNASLPSAESTEVLGSLWYDISVKLESDAARSSASNRDIEEDLRVLHRHRRSTTKCKRNDLSASYCKDACSDA
jgi:hypothetical protein